MSSAIIQRLLLAILLSVDKVISSTLIPNESSTMKTLQLSNFSDVTVSTSVATNEGSTPNESKGPLNICLNTSCNGRCGDVPDPYRYYPCACDIHCTTFKDCCVDFQSRCGNSSLGTGLKPRLEECDGSSESCLSCVDHDQFMFRPLYMVSRCPEHYGNQFVIDRCQNTSPLVLLHLPVYANVSGYMYRNVYCAICHDVDVTKIKLYRTEILCPCNETDSKVYLEGVLLSEQKFTEIYEYHCKIDIIEPDEADYPDRSCIPVVLGSCPNPGLLQDYCHQYLEPVRVVQDPDDIKSSTITARNQYCVRCSAFASNEMNCWKKRFTGGGIFTDGLRFSVLFDFSSDIQISKDTQAAPILTVPLQSQYDVVLFENYMFKLVVEFPSEVDPEEIQQTISRVLDTESVYITECSEISSIQNNVTRIYNVNGTMPNTELFAEPLIEIVDSFFHDTRGAGTVLFAFLTNTIFSLDTICMAPMKYYNNDTFSNLLGVFQYVVSNSTGNNVTSGVNFPLEIVWGKRGNQTINSSCENIEIVQDELSPVFVVCGDVLESHCNFIAYDVDDLLNTTKSQNLSELGMNFQYELNSVVAVCRVIPLIEVDTPSDLRRSEAEFYITVIGCTLSILGLLVTVCTYCTFTELRNLAGKCILNLVGSMLGAQSLFVLGGVVAWRNDVTCQTVAVVQHLLWLATFSWTNILSYDLARTFSGKASVPRARTGQKRFWVYCGIAWIVPASVVALSAGLNYSHVINVDYGKNGVCWIRDRLALLATFIAPVSAHVMFNISAFSYTVYHIRKITKLAADMNVTSEKRSQLGVYARITAIMGFTWIIGYLGNIWPIEALWLIFAALNSLQGFLIFVAFVLTSKVLRLFRKRFLGELSSSSTVRMSSTATSSSNLLHASSTAL